MSEFTPFFFDGNSWYGVVDSAEKWFKLLTHYANHDDVLNAKVAPQENIEELPRHYHFGAPGVRTGDMPSFGFRREHTGTTRLEDWAILQGMDLRGLVSKNPAKKKRRWWLLWLA